MDILQLISTNLKKKILPQYILCLSYCKQQDLTDFFYNFIFCHKYLNFMKSKVMINSNQEVNTLKAFYLVQVYNCIFFATHKHSLYQNIVFLCHLLMVTLSSPPKKSQTILNFKNKYIAFLNIILIQNQQIGREILHISACKCRHRSTIWLCHTNHRCNS